MKYTDWIIPRLRDLEAERAALKNIPERILVLEMAFDGLKASNTEDTVVSGGENHREEAMLANIAERDELERNLKITGAEVQQIERELGKLEPREIIVLTAAYIEHQKGYAEQLAERMGCDVSTVHRIRREALVKLAKRLHGVANL